MASSLLSCAFENIAAAEEHIVDFTYHEDPQAHKSFIQRLVDASFMGPKCDTPMDSDEENLLRLILNCQVALALILDKRKVTGVKNCPDKQPQYLLAMSNFSQVLVKKVHVSISLMFNCSFFMSTKGPTAQLF
jgi:hypothetical protein